MLNHTVLMGRIGQDLELKSTPSGTEVVSFNLAVPRNYNKEITDWISVVAWKGTATTIAKHFRKGDTICVEGNIQTRNYDDKDGKKVYVTEVVVEKIHFVTVKKEASAGENTGTTNDVPDTDAFEVVPDEENLPFY